MKRNYLTLSLFLLSLTAYSQVSLRTSDIIRLGDIVKTINTTDQKHKAAPASQSKVDIIMRYDSQSALDEIKSRGGEIISLVGTRTAIVRVAASAAQKVAGADGVTGAMLSTKLKHANDKALPASFVDLVQSGEGLDHGYDGAGIVVGLFDTGIDPNHINFTDADGNNRVKVVYSYPGSTSVPEIYDTPAKISTYDCDTRSESHGTHVLGIMAGSFTDSSTDGAPDYRGIARGAEIAVACGDGYNAQILDGMERICKYAESQGKRCVLNLSFGDNVGPHDGSDEFTEALNDIAVKYNAIMCLAAGNEREQAISIIKELPASDPTLKTLLVKGDTEVGGNFQTYGPIEIWTSDNTPFDVTFDIISRTAPDKSLYSFDVPDKKETYVVQGDNINQFLDNTGRMTLIKEGTEFHNLYTNSFMGGIKGLDPYNKRYYARLNVYIEGRTAATVSRNFVKVTVKGQSGQKIFMYCDGTYMNFGNRNIPGLDIPDGNGTNSNMSSGKSTVAVGSYVTANISGSGYRTSTVGEPSYFSSYGETPDGRVMPVVCAPGQVIVSSRNSYMPTSSGYVTAYPLHYSYLDKKSRKTYYWTTCAGTSQATPHMAGIAALWLQANPELTIDDILDVASRTATLPETGKGWGNGKVDAWRGIKSILGMSSIYDIIDNAPESIIIEPCSAGYSIYAPGQDSLAVTLHDLSGRTVASASVSGDTADIATSSLPAGVYILKAEGSHTCRTAKVLVK